MAVELIAKSRASTACSTLRSVAEELSAEEQIAAEDQIA